MAFPAVYGIVVGVLMIAQWLFFLAAGKVPELRTEPARIGFHLAGEFLTAAALIVAGLALLRGAAWGHVLYPTSIGILLYTTIASPGYFAQQRAWPLVGMFAVLLVLALVSLGLFIGQAV